MNIPFYKVGGCVRDEILGIKSKDIDYAVEAPSFNAMREAILERNGKIFLETPEYLTIRAKVPALGACDYVLCRKDGEYKDGRRPETVEVGTIFDDLMRRDFTMNAIAIREDGIVLDPHNGKTDIEFKTIRAVGNPKKRLEEDTLRAFRAVRFKVTKGFFIEASLAREIMQLGIRDFSGVSTDRIRDELVKMFSHDTHFSVSLLLNDYFNLWQVAISRKIWLFPTIRSV